MMVRNTFILVLSLVMSTRLLAVEDLPRAVDMFPAETQAFVWMPSSKSFLDNWAETELGKLAADERLKEFWISQQEEISNRFSNAGWQLSLKLDDLP